MRNKVGENQIQPTHMDVIRQNILHTYYSHTTRGTLHTRMYLVVHKSDLAEDGPLAPSLVVDAACVVVISHLNSVH